MWRMESKRRDTFEIFVEIDAHDKGLGSGLVGVWLKEDRVWNLSLGA